MADSSKKNKTNVGRWTRFKEACKRHPIAERYKIFSESHPLLSKVLRTLIVVQLALLAVVLLVSTYFSIYEKKPAVTLSEEHTQMQKVPVQWKKTERDVTYLLEDIKTNKVTHLGMVNSAILVTTSGPSRYFVSDRGGQIADILLNEYRKTTSKPIPLLVVPPVVETPILENIRNIVGISLPLAILIGVIYMFKYMDKGSFKLATATNVTFKDVIGAQEAKNALVDIMEYLKNPQPFIDVGARPPAGVLMIGPPGTGKTRLAQALAGECGVNFIATSGSEFTSKYFGAGVTRVKQLFAFAREHAPVCIFIDECDGLGSRGVGTSAAETESNRIINQILIEMDGFAPGEQIIVIGATNRMENIDAGLLREGRFDRRIHVHLPDVASREAIFKLYAAKIRTAPDIDFAQLARLTTGLAPATLEAIVNQAALISARAKLPEAGQKEFSDAIETIRMGELNTSQAPMSQSEKERVAVHEAGHAIVAGLLKVGRVEKVSILPRGAALGVTLVTPEEDKALYLESELNSRIQMLLAGRNAEIVMYGEASNGAAQDLEESSKIALAMVARYGFGPDESLFSIGALPQGQSAQNALGTSVSQAKAILATANKECRDLLFKHKAIIENLRDELLKKETVEGDEVLAMLSNKPLLTNQAA